MSQPTYLYFNVRGRGELPRLVAAAGGISFEDKRIKGMEEWQAEYKSKTPYGQAPCLIIDDKWYAQKLAIALYFARQCGLYPTGGDPKEALDVDFVLQFSEEILENIIQGIADRLLNSKPETQQKLIDEVLPQKLPKLEAVVKASGTGFCAGNKLSIADLSAFDVLEHVVDLCGQAHLDKFPSLKAVFEKVGQHPGVKKYVDSRPPVDEGFDI